MQFMETNFVTFPLGSALQIVEEKQKNSMLQFLNTCLVQTIGPLLYNPPFISRAVKCFLYH